MSQMETTPNSPTFIGAFDFAQSSSTINFQANHHDSVGLKTTQIPTVRDAPQFLANKSTSHKPVDSAHSSPLQSTAGLAAQDKSTPYRADTVEDDSTSVRKKQPYEGLLMRPHPVEDEEEDNFRQFIVRIVRRSVPLIKSKNWKNLPVFYDDDEDEK